MLFVKFDCGHLDNIKSEKNVYFGSVKNLTDIVTPIHCI